MNNTKTYNVIRFYKNSNRRKVILRKVSLNIAQTHCSDVRTSKKGIYFDGFYEVN